MIPTPVNSQLIDWMFAMDSYASDDAVEYVGT
jgi:hypothetical protein